MQKLTQTELGWVCCAIDAEINRYAKIATNKDESNADRAFANLRKEGLESVWKRLDRAYRDDNRRIEVIVE